MGNPRVGHSSRFRSVRSTYCVPHNDLNVASEPRAVHVLTRVQVEEIAEVVKHVAAVIQLHEHDRAVNCYVTTAALHRFKLQLREIFQLGVPVKKHNSLEQAVHY